MDPKDAQGFFADDLSLDLEEHLILTYIFETDGDPRIAAASLASEQSTAQWKRPGVDEDFRPRHAARVISFDVIDEHELSSFSTPAKDNKGFKRARVRIAYPYRNFGSRIPNLLTAAMGEGAFFSPMIAAIKLIDIEFPDRYLATFEGPRFGVKALREMLGVWDRPLFFGVVKPNIGLDPFSFAALAKDAWEGGLDAAKDDEMLADAEYSPFEVRMREVGRAKREAEAKTGNRKIFIANITDEVDRLRQLHDVAIASGINAVMLNVMAVGLSAVRCFAKISHVPVIAHFDCIAPMSRHPYFGVSTQVITKLQRICGCDAIIMPGFGARMMTSDEEVTSNAHECSKVLGTMKPALPVPGGSDWAGTLPMMYEKLRTLDFAMVPGRGVFGHPMGPKAGAMSLVQAWNSIVQRIPLADYASDHVELKEAINTFGGGHVPVQTSEVDASIFSTDDRDNKVDGWRYQ